MTISTGVRKYVATVTALALALLVLLAVPGDRIRWGELVLFLFLFALVETRPVRLGGDPSKGRSFTLAASFMVAVVAIVRMPPLAVAIICAGGALLTNLADRLAFHRLVFNSAQYALAAGLAGLTYHAVYGGYSIEPDALVTIMFATAASTAVFFLVNTAAVSGAIAISTQSSFLRTWMRSYGWTTATWVAFGASGIVLASLYQLSPFSLPLLFVPLLVARSAFHSYQDVNHAYDSTVRAFVRAIEAKDAYTRGHSERVADFGKMIAERTGMRDRDLDVFFYGALLHDVGKLVVRKAVLTKPSRLEPSEFDEIKKHPVIGAQIVNEIEFLQPAIDGVLSHHERLDGSGYPAGLSGDLVPRHARIMAVADTYDAMTSTRAYRGARTAQEAIDELIRLSGTMYDTRCVEAFLEALAEREPVESRKATHEAQTVPSAT